MIKQLLHQLFTSPIVRPSWSLVKSLANSRRTLSESGKGLVSTNTHLVWSESPHLHLEISKMQGIPRAIHQTPGPSPRLCRLRLVRAAQLPPLLCLGRERRGRLLRRSGCLGAGSVDCGGSDHIFGVPKIYQSRLDGWCLLTWVDV